MAEVLKFPGSPTIRINGKDIADTHKYTGYSQQCRVYEADGILQGIPSEKLIRKAITENR